MIKDLEQFNDVSLRAVERGGDLWAAFMQSKLRHMQPAEATPAQSGGTPTRLLATQKRGA